MEQQELMQLLNDLRAMPAETEWLEFKEAKSTFDSGKIGNMFQP
ncbi:hypothetical protein [Paenibacillus koleovorans]|nr:hypothetical protein [Paenibacillus koleovorans]